MSSRRKYGELKKVYYVVPGDQLFNVQVTTNNVLSTARSVTGSRFEYPLDSIDSLERFEDDEYRYVFTALKKPYMYNGESLTYTLVQVPINDAQSEGVGIVTHECRKTMVVDDDKLTGYIDSVFVYILTLMATDRINVQCLGDSFRSNDDECNDTEKFCLKGVRAQVKGRKSSKIDQGVIGIVPEDDEEYGTIYLYPDGVLFVVNDYVTAFYIKYSVMTVGCHFGNSKHSDHVELGVFGGDKPNWGVNFVVRCSQYEQLEMYLKTKIRPELIYNRVTTGKTASGSKKDGNVTVQKDNKTSRTDRKTTKKSAAPDNVMPKTLKQIAHGRDINQPSSSSQVNSAGQTGNSFDIEEMFKQSAPPTSTSQQSNSKPPARGNKGKQTERTTTIIKRATRSTNRNTAPVEKHHVPDVDEAVQNLDGNNNETSNTPGEQTERETVGQHNEEVETDETVEDDDDKRDDDDEEIVTGEEIEGEEVDESQEDSVGEHADDVDAAHQEELNVDDDPDGYVMVNSERRVGKYNKKPYIVVDTESLDLDASRAYSRKWKNLLNDRKFQERREERRLAKLIETKKKKKQLIPGPVKRRRNSRFLTPKVVGWNFKGPLWLLKQDYPERYLELLNEAAENVFAGFNLSPTSDTVVAAVTGFLANRAKPKENKSKIVKESRIRRAGKM